jgi:hypothetical protein
LSHHNEAGVKSQELSNRVGRVYLQEHADDHVDQVFIDD